MCEKNLRNEMEFNYDFCNFFVVCGVMYILIYCGSRDVLCFYCKVCFVFEIVNSLCLVCDFVVVGVDVLGLFCFFL